MIQGTGEGGTAWDAVSVLTLCVRCIPLLLSCGGGSLVFCLIVLHFLLKLTV